MWCVYVNDSALMGTALCRDQFVTAAGRAHLLGGTPFNLVAHTRNAGVKVHLDTGDGPLSVILWLPLGVGKLKGGHFCLPSLGLRFVPLNCTLVVLAAGVVAHGSLQPASMPGGNAVRVGMSAFQRIADVQALTTLAWKKGGADRLEAAQAEADKRLNEAQGRSAKAQVRESTKADRAKLQASRNSSEAPSAFLDVWEPVDERVGVQRLNLLGWAKW